MKSVIFAFIIFVLASSQAFSKDIKGKNVSMEFEGETIENVGSRGIASLDSLSVVGGSDRQDKSALGQGVFSKQRMKIEHRKEMKQNLREIQDW